MPEADHLHSLEESPRDWARRRAYADWLEERADPRAELLRLEAALRDDPLGSLQRRSHARSWRKLRATLDPEWLARVRSDAVIPPWFPAGDGPLSRRGVLEFYEWMTRSHWEWVIVTVAAPLELVTPALIESRCVSSPQRFLREGRWLPNLPVLPPQEFEPVSAFVPLVQMRGQPWTVAIYDSFHFNLPGYYSAQEDACELSRHFGTVAVEFSSEDTSSATGYHLFQCGELAESAEWEAGEGRFTSQDRGRR